MPCWGSLTYQGATSPWSPQMTAWSGDPVPIEMVKKQSPVELMGAVVFQNKNCRNCHALEGVGGQRGPDLTVIGIAVDARTVDRSDLERHARRRQHAGLWQAGQPGRDERAGRVFERAATRRVNRTCREPTPYLRRALRTVPQSWSRFELEFNQARYLDALAAGHGGSPKIWCRMQWTFYLFGSGLVFFIGVGLIVAGLATSFGRGRILASAAPVLMVVGTILAVYSATPLPTWFYLFAILLTIAWLIVDHLGSRVPARARHSARGARRAGLAWRRDGGVTLPFAAHGSEGRRSTTLSLRRFTGGRPYGRPDEELARVGRRGSRFEPGELRRRARRWPRPLSEHKMLRSATESCFWRSEATTCLAQRLPKHSQMTCGGCSSVSADLAERW